METKGTYLDVAEASPRPPAWVIENLLPLGLTIIGAPPKTGKSTLTLAMAAIIAKWECRALPPHLSKVKRKGPTLVITDEAEAGELKHTLKEGLRVKPVADGSVLYAEDPWDFQLDTEEGLGLVLHDLKVLDPRLVVIDPFRDFHSLEEKDSAGMVRILKPLRKWAVDNDSAIVICHHTTKPPQGEAKDWKFSASDLRGSGAIFGKADGVLMLTPLKGNDASQLTVRATFKRARSWESEIHLAIWDSPVSQGTEKLRDIEKTVLNALKKRMSPQSISDQLQLGKRAMLDIVNKLRRNGFIR